MLLYIDFGDNCLLGAIFRSSFFVYPTYREFLFSLLNLSKSVFLWRRTSTHLSRSPCRDFIVIFRDWLLKVIFRRCDAKITPSKGFWPPVIVVWGLREFRPSTGYLLAGICKIATRSGPLFALHRSNRVVLRWPCPQVRVPEETSRRDTFFAVEPATASAEFRGHSTPRTSLDQSLETRGHAAKSTAPTPLFFLTFLSAAVHYLCKTVRFVSFLFI